LATFKNHTSVQLSIQKTNCVENKKKIPALGCPSKK